LSCQISQIARSLLWWGVSGGLCDGAACPFAHAAGTPRPTGSEQSRRSDGVPFQTELQRLKSELGEAKRAVAPITKPRRKRDLEEGRVQASRGPGGSSPGKMRPRPQTAEARRQRERAAEGGRPLLTAPSPRLLPPASQGSRSACPGRASDPSRSADGSMSFRDRRVVAGRTWAVISKKPRRQPRQFPQLTTPGGEPAARARLYFVAKL